MNIKDLQKKVIAFRDRRDWKQFHNAKDVSLSMVLEAGEVMEHFQWKNKAEMAKHIKNHKEEIGEELADVFYWVLLMSYDLKIDLAQALIKKITTNEKKYPIKKSKGKHTKYTDL